MNNNYFEYYADISDIRLDHFLTKKMLEMSRSQIQKLIRAGVITVNDEQVNAGFVLDGGDKISGYKKSYAFSPIEPEPIPLEIIAPEQ